MFVRLRQGLFRATCGLYIVHHQVSRLLFTNNPSIVLHARGMS